MADFIIVNKGHITLCKVGEGWPEFPNEALKKHPKARLYRKKFLLNEYYEYSLDKAKRHPRMVRRNTVVPEMLPAAVKLALLLNPL